MVNARFRFRIVATLLVSGGLSLAGSVLVFLYFSEWHWVNETLHVLMEGTGALIALAVALFLLQMRSRQNAPHFTWMAAALLGMGILDGIHAGLREGPVFVGTHSMAKLAGGLLFSLVWLPDRLARGRFAKAWPAGIAVAATLAGILAVSSHKFPAMLDEDLFTSAAKSVNFVGGVFFLAAAANLLLRYRKRRNESDLVFANHCLLFGVAGGLFAYSTLWDAAWWAWHLLRLLAYFIALGYAFHAYHRLEQELYGSEMHHRALLNAIPDLIFHYDLDGTLLDFRAPAVSPPRKKPPEMPLGASIYESLMPRDVVDKVMAASGRAVETGGVQTVEFVYPTETGRRHYEARIATSGARELVATVRDITERKEAEEAVLQSQVELRALAGRLIAVTEEDSKRLARELHDSFSQRLAVLGMEVAALEQQLGAPSEVMNQSLRRMGVEVGKLAKDIHEFARELHPSIIDDLGLTAALRAECGNFSRQYGVAVQFLPRNVPDSLPAELSLCLYRIVQESLWNIARHAQALEARVTLACDDGELLLSVEDDGNGFDLETVRGKGRLGLVSMEERTRLIRGDFSVHSLPGEGTRIQVRAPFTRREKQELPL